MAFGCEQCGYTSRHIRAVTPGDSTRRCPECGSPLEAMTLGAALQLAREREEARRWRVLAGLAPEPAGDTPAQPA